MKAITMEKLRDTIREQDSEIRAWRREIVEKRRTVREQDSEIRALRRQHRRLQLEIEYYERLAARDPEHLVVLLTTSNED